MAYISIIVPCYNAEQYVDRCLETLVSQTIGIDNLEQEILQCQRKDFA